MAKKTKSKADASSTEVRLRGVMRHQQVSGQAEYLMAVNGLASVAEVDSFLADGARVAAAVEQASAPALAILDLLVQLGGAATRDAIGKLVQIPGIDQSRLDVAGDTLARQGIVYLIEAPTYWGEKPTPALALGAEVAGHVVPRVRGVSLPPALVGEPQPDTRARRDCVAALAACAHHTIKAASSNPANRSSTKKLAALLDQPNDEVAARIDEAVYSGIMVRADGLVRVDAPALLRHARGELPLDPLEARSCFRTLPRSGAWVSTESVVRRMAESAAHFAILHGQIDLELAQTVSQLRAALRRFADADHAVVDGHEYLRRPQPTAGELRGDGHITPSFEILLGPDASPELVAILGLAAELVRLDRVVTLRLTPRSVATAIGLGVSLTQIEEALCLVSRHPVPENVSFLVRDWGSAVKSARVEKVWSIETSSAEAADVALKALGDAVLSRPNPTTLLVRVDLRDPHPALRKAGLQLPAPAPAPRREPIESTRPGQCARDPMDSSEPMRARYLREVHEGCPPSAAESELQRPARGRGSPEQDLTPMEALHAAASAQPELASLLLRLEKLWKAAWPQWTRWAEGLEGDEGERALALASLQPLVFLPFIALTPKWRTRTLASSSSVDDVLDKAEVYPPTHLSGPGSAATQALARAPSSVLAAFDELAGRLLEPELLLADDPAPSPSGPAQRAVPATAQRADPANVLREFLAAAEAGSSVKLQVSSKTSGDRTFELRPERALERGTDITLLGVDTKTDENRSFPLANVLSLVPLPPAH